MGIRAKLELAGGGLLLFLLLTGGWYWHRAEMLNAQAEAKSAVLQQTLDREKSNRDAQDRAWQAERQVLEAQMAQIRTLAQARPIITPILSAPVPQQQVTKAELPAEVQKALPDAPGAKYTLFTDQQMVELAKYKVACDEVKGELAHCQADQVSLESSLKGAQEQAKVWEKAAKGGSWIRRLGKDAVKVGIGVGIGIALKH